MKPSNRLYLMMDRKAKFFIFSVSRHLYIVKRRHCSTKGRRIAMRLLVFKQNCQLRKEEDDGKMYTIDTLFPFQRNTAIYTKACVWAKEYMRP